MDKVAEVIIDEVHSLWEKHKATYPAGYAVFYSPPRLRPDLMLIGLNPGGDEHDFHRTKERLMSPAESMEYVECQATQPYALATKTVSLFQSIGMLEVLKRSLKTNLNFFRSKKWGTLPKQHSAICQDIALRVVKKFEPKVVLCESMFVFDRVHKRMAAQFPMQGNCETGRRGRRIFASVTSQTSSRPTLLVGMTHLTGSRPSINDLERIKQLLGADLRRTLHK